MPAVGCTAYFRYLTLQEHTPLFDRKRNSYVEPFTNHAEASMKNFIPQSILFLNQAEGDNCSSLKSSHVINGFVKGSKERFTRFHTACIQTFNKRKQHCRNFNFWVLGYRKVYATLGKDRDNEIEKRIL